MKKFLSRFLAIVLLILSSSILFACKDDNREYKANIYEGDVALLSLFSYDGKSESKYWGLSSLGHAFLSLDNISDNTITIGNRDILPSETIAFGTWSIWEHFGVWYNIESNYISKHNKYDGRVSVTISLNQEELDRLIEYTMSNDNWNPIKNCSCFALNLWNEVAEETEKLNKPLIYTPSFLCEEIYKFGKYETNKPIITTEKSGYFTSAKDVFFEIEGDNYAEV
jgi:hypothetical protein